MAVTTTDLGFLLARATQRWNELLLQRFASRGFPEVRPSYGSILVPLFERDGLRVGELGAIAGLSKQKMTKLVARCEADGLVARRPDPHDGRAARLVLTDRGHELEKVAGEVLAELDELVTTALGATRRDALTEALQGVIRI